MPIRREVRPNPDEFAWLAVSRMICLTDPVPFGNENYVEEVFSFRGKWHNP